MFSSCLCGVSPISSNLQKNMHFIYVYCDSTAPRCECEYAWYPNQSVFPPLCFNLVCLVYVWPIPCITFLSIYLFDLSAIFILIEAENLHSPLSDTSVWQSALFILDGTWYLHPHSWFVTNGYKGSPKKLWAGFKIHQLVNDVILSSGAPKLLVRILILLYSCFFFVLFFYF